MHHLEPFEKKKNDIFEFIGIASDRVARLENREKIHDPGKFGDVTQCRANKKGGLATCLNTSSPWFGAVDVWRGGPYNIYSILVIKHLTPPSV